MVKRGSVVKFPGHYWPLITDTGIDGGEGTTKAGVGELGSDLP